MPLRCMDEHGTVIEATGCSDEEWFSLRERARKARNLRMPCCPARAVLKTSKLGTRFFAHKARGACDWKRETDVHLRLKALALTAARDAGWEAQSEVSGHTPDGEKWMSDVLAWKGEEKVAVEIQWSGQTNEETWRRQHRYERAGVRGVWLLRQPGFPIAPELAAACIGGSMSEGLRILLPKYDDAGAQDRKNSLKWLQNLGPEEFLAAVFEGRFLFGTGHISTMSFGIETGVMECWRCNALTRIVTRFSGRAGPHRPYFRLQDDGCSTNLAALVQELTHLRPDIGTVKERFSHTLQHSYLSNGCSQCDALIGQFHEHDAWYVQEETVGVAELELDREARNRGFYESNRWGVWTEGELANVPMERQQADSDETWQTITIEGAGSATVRTSPIHPLCPPGFSSSSDATSGADEETAERNEEEDERPGYRIRQNFPSPPAGARSEYPSGSSSLAEIGRDNHDGNGGRAGHSILSDFQLPGSAPRK